MDISGVLTWGMRRSWVSRHIRATFSWVEHIVAAIGATRLLALARARLQGSEPRRDVAPPAPREDRPVGDHGLYERVPAWKRRDQDKAAAEAAESGWFDRHLLARDRVLAPSYSGFIEEPPQGDGRKVGICCSGGGIRSAAFNLGALQELAAAERLHEAKYLAAVSGGSYMAAGLAMVAKTHGKDPNSDDSDLDLFKGGRGPFYRGSPEEQYLRNRASYMAPGGGGRMRLVLRIALGLLVNVALFAAAMVLLACLLWLFYSVAQPKLPASAGEAAAGTRPLEWMAIGAAAGLGILCGIFSIFVRPTADSARRRLDTVSLWCFGIAVALAVVAVGIPAIVAALRNGAWSNADLKDAVGPASAATGGGLGALLGAVLLELRSKLSVAGVKEGAKWYQKLTPRLQAALVDLITWLLGPLLLSAVLVGALVVMLTADDWVRAVMAVLGVVLVAAFFRFADVTSWSLHPFYRRRLCTAFALKRVKGPGDGSGRGMAVERRYADLVPLSKSGITPGPDGPFTSWPTLVVCAAANVSDPGVVPPGRTVTSFTFSPVAMGGPLVGGVPTETFEEYVGPGRKRDFTLAAAVAMSGAAISPSMGKDTRASARFLLGLANVRLGVWVPNPRQMDQWLEGKRGCRTLLATRKHVLKSLTYERARVEPEHVHAMNVGDDAEQPDRYRKWLLAPRAGPWYLVKEMLGWNSVNDRYLYVTDGGHYENLGLVELLRRGCSEIYCFDASGGRSLTALGDAIALARSELGVDIKGIDVGPLKASEDERLAEKCCATARIRYPKDKHGKRPPDGVLVYVRSVVTKDAPYDVQAFRLRDESFPHHSTFDQLYDDQKFEAYRELGAYNARVALEEPAVKRGTNSPAPA